MEEYVIEKWVKDQQCIILENRERAVHYAAEHWISCAHEAIRDHGVFFVALSGGATPRAIFALLTSSPFVETIPWQQIHFFWSDERAVPPDHVDSNFRTAMEAGLRSLAIPSAHIHRMIADRNLEEEAIAYEKEILATLGSHPFDLIMLGVGEDGHTASLFPTTSALSIHDRLVVANFVPKLNSWRMTFTYSCLNRARNTALYLFGESKREIVQHLFTGAHQPTLYPVQGIENQHNPPLWILDAAAAALLPPLMKNRKNRLH
jgi:6-phosphogluconolactonase